MICERRLPQAGAVSPVTSATGQVMFRTGGEQFHEALSVLVGLAQQPWADRAEARWQRHAEKRGQLAHGHGQVASHVLIDDLERGDRVGSEPVPPPGLAFFRVPQQPGDRVPVERRWRRWLLTVGQRILPGGSGPPLGDRLPHLVAAPEPDIAQSGVRRREHRGTGGATADSQARQARSRSSASPK